jgi:rhamnulokinase
VVDAFGSKDDSSGETKILAGCLAVDLGASSGRVIAGTFDGAVICVREITRFENGGVRRHGSLYWDFEKLWDEIRVGLSAGIEHLHRLGVQEVSIGVDSWGVDFGLLN